MSDLDFAADALREGRAALLNPNLSEPERAASVKIIEGALDIIKMLGPEAEILRPATAEDLRRIAEEDAAGPFPPDEP